LSHLYRVWFWGAPAVIPAHLVLQAVAAVRSAMRGASRPNSRNTVGTPVDGSGHGPDPRASTAPERRASRKTNPSLGLQPTSCTKLRTDSQPPGPLRIPRSSSERS
jgi:hypothetical protein